LQQSVFTTIYVIALFHRPGFCRFAKSFTEKSAHYIVRAVLSSQVLFRCNGSAVLLTNRSRDVPRAKYTLQHIVRINLAADDTAYNCVVQVSAGSRLFVALLCSIALCTWYSLFSIG
jgi:hypothetical protein